MILDNTSKTIQIVLGEAMTTTQPEYTTAYEDINVAGGTFVAGATDGSLNGVALVTVIAAPASSTQRRVKEISVYNSDTVNHAVTVQYYDGTNTELIVKTTIAPGQTLWYGGGSWQVLFGTTGNNVIISGGTIDGTTIGGGTPAPGTFSTLAITSETVAEATAFRQQVYAAPFDALAFNGMQVNGSMEVSQITGTNAVTATGYVVDGMQMSFSGSMAMSTAQVTDAPPGYNNSLKATVTTAEASMSAGDYVFFNIPIEGYRTVKLAFGVASAQPVSIGFYIKANRTGTYSGSIRNSALNRAYPFSFTINSSGTWQFITVTIPGDTAGTWLTTTGVGLNLAICMACGSTYTGTVSTWASANYIGTTGTTNGVAATSDYMQITGLIVLPGIEMPNSTRAPFIMRPYTDELPLCQRYLAVLLAGSTYTAFGAGFAYTTSGAQFFLPYPVLMRAAPTITQSNTGAYTPAAGIVAITSLGTSFIGTESALMEIAVAGTPLTTGAPAFWVADNNVAAYIELNAQM